MPFSFRHLLAALLVLATATAHGQAATTFDLKKNFGAVGDGRADDAPAFRRAADFLNQRATTPAGATRAVLRIPAGTYRVGTPGPASQPDLLPLRGCRNLSIVGDDSARTVIRYADGLRYGAFDPATRQPHEAGSAWFTDPNYAVNPGVAIRLEDCADVTVSDLALDGNSAHLLVGGHWGDTGIQLAHDGLFVYNSRRVQLRRLAVHHFGRDGAQVLNHLAKNLDDPAQEGIVLENCRFDYNGRQGLSITGVNGLRAANCSFSHTGRVVVPALGKALFSNPGAGVDIEPEGGFASNVRLEGCRFVNNAGQGIVSDRPNLQSHATRSIVVSNGLLWGTTNWSAWVTQPDFLFQNCRIYGAFVHGCKADNPREATRFVGCTFEDRPYHGQPAYGPDLLHSDGAARYLSFTDCRFVGTRASLLWAIVSAPPAGGIPDSASFFHLRRCTFLFDYTQPAAGPYDNLQGAVFTGRNVLQDGPHRTSQHHTSLTLGNGAPATPTVVRAPGSLQLLANNCDFSLINGLDVGRAPARARDSASLVIGSNNLLVVRQTFAPRPELYVGPTSRLVVRRGGALEIQANTRLTLAGELVVEDGAYFYLDPAATMTTVGRGRLRLGARAIRGRRPG